MGPGVQAVSSSFVFAIALTMDRSSVSYSSSFVERKLGADLRRYCSFGIANELRSSNRAS